ncbi:uncharacterized protein [Rutidosis leptorrhynchoides]|uniref:uncharacterized protein isoform X2 n=1 Tax=Rutidosis leptorrhynchoides TaxID=125765 RepID=UPI003A99E947
MYNRVIEGFLKAVKKLTLLIAVMDFQINPSHILSTIFQFEDSRKVQKTGDGEPNQAAVFDSLELEPFNVDEISSPNTIEGASISSVHFYTPNGSRYFIPEVQTTYKPVVGTMFNSVEEALVLYQGYAKKAGFSVRKYTAKRKANGDLSHRLFVCNRQGKPYKKTGVDSLQPAVQVDKSQEQNENVEGTSEQNIKKKPQRRRRNSNMKVTLLLCVSLLFSCDI